MKTIALKIRQNEKYLNISRRLFAGNPECNNFLTNVSFARKNLQKMSIDDRLQIRKVSITNRQRSWMKYSFGGVVYGTSVFTYF